ncbi:23S rRNA C2498 ribose 2'-O-ribose methyltransferase [Glaesserella parasuis ZJ0906]|uniref:23S rRNA C2498 ribose 2'-O-ribose methyltransferase n=1 Tax=Glaesserella parasuis ZJ0906 TaxID=1322346 RepID=A0A806JAN9_GLAPU|nr:23S rRNA C2498 ribose 2'-O-ribose methyltransferase [Glaesserella parasuis ZJ0906]EQA09156.1 ribosomal RNA large subunit methyltransferase M [Glaesserella parasuis 84-15995]KDD81886.1 methyltransferase [Glaesserella parasuis ST4-2]MCT8555343.1 methyltransferase [Glaesserella parasuis]MCT8704410.1 methyltransferase [Glaesserella parasuis]
MNKLALHRRAGFEKEVAGEINDKAAQLGIYGFANLKENSGYVIFECYQAGEADRLARELAFNQLIFVRQMIVVGELLQEIRLLRY